MNTVRNILHQIPVFLVALPAFIVLHLHVQFGPLMEYRHVYRPIAELFLASFLVLAVCLPAFRRNRVKAYVCAFTVLLFFFFFADVKDGLTEWGIHANYTVALIASAAILGLVFFLIARARRMPDQTLFFLNLLPLLFLLSEVFFLLRPADRRRSVTSHGNFLAKGYEPCRDCRRPDIHYLVFDAYTSSPVLQREFGYSNARLDSFLTKQGFTVFGESRSNYNITPFSIAAALNMNYHDRLDTSGKFYMKKFLPGLAAVYQNALVPLLEKEGYTFVNNSIFKVDGYEPLNPPFDLWDFQAMYERHNLFRKLDADIGWSFRLWLGVSPRSSDYAADKHRHVLDTYNTLIREARNGHNGKPRFIYSHFMIPHHPYTFDSLGRTITDDRELPLPDEKARYVMQVVFANKLIRESIQEILRQRTRPVVIILQGDHGFKFNQPGKKREEFANLNAIYSSGDSLGFKAGAISPVNTFRVILNQRFHRQLTLLPDRSVFLRH